MQKIFLLFILFTFSFKVYSQTSPASGSPSASKDTSAVKKDRLTRFGPAILYYNLDKGQSGTEIFNIVNFTDKTAQFELSVTNFTKDSMGTIVYLDSSNKSNSCADWISIDKPFVEVGPNEHAKISFTVKVPEDDAAVKAMKWAMVKVHKVQEKITYNDAPGSYRINKDVSVAAQLYQTPPNLSKELKMLSFKPLNDSTYRLGCQNLGGTMLTCEFKIELSSTENDIKTSLLEKDVRILPGLKRYVDLVIPKTVSKGRYTAIAMIDAGDDDVPLEAAQTTIEVN